MIESSAAPNPDRKPYDTNVFNEDIYNFQRIRLAPTLVIIGLGIEIYAILSNPKK